MTLDYDLAIEPRGQGWAVLTVEECEVQDGLDKGKIHHTAQQCSYLDAAQGWTQAMVDQIADCLDKAGYRVRS
jgi:hypothetical protein